MFWLVKIIQATFNTSLYICERNAATWYIQRYNSTLCFTGTCREMQWLVASLCIWHFYERETSADWFLTAKSWFPVPLSHLSNYAGSMFITSLEVEDLIECVFQKALEIIKVHCQPINHAKFLLYMTVRHPCC